MRWARQQDWWPCAIGIVRIFFAGRALAVTNPTPVPDFWDTTVYTTAEVPWRLASPRSIDTMGSWKNANLRGISALSGKLLVNLCHLFTMSSSSSSSQDLHLSQMSRYINLPTSITGDTTPKGSHTATRYLSISRLVTSWVFLGMQLRECRSPCFKSALQV